MTFPPIPVTAQEDEAFNELGAGSDPRTARNGADAPTANTKTPRDAALSRPQTFTEPKDGPPPLTDAVAATHQSPRDVSSSLASRGESSAMSPAGVQAERGSTREGSDPVSFLSLSMSPVAFTLGIWTLYAFMALTAWRTVR